LSDLSEYYARRFKVPKVKKLHFDRWWNDGKTLCGENVGSTVQTTSDPNKITCRSCKGSPHLDGMLGNMTHTGH
jgi:hypothetical protein